MFLSAYSPDNYRTMIPPRLVLIPNYRFTKSSILMYIKTLIITNCVRFYAKKSERVNVEHSKSGKI
jgi:hypothetical protein